ncbi:MAG: hypothetical protein AAGE86_12520 [Pseudomonadota bacterium]
MSKPGRYDGMLHEYCVGCGYCGGSVHVNDLLPKQGKIDAHAFVLLLLQAEHDGEASDTYQYHEHFKGLVSIFEKHFGAGEVDLSLLCWWD